MRKMMMALAAVAFAALIAGQTNAQDEPKGKRGNFQPGQGGGRGFGGGMGGGSVYGFLANNKALQEELKISEDQIKKFADVAKEQQGKMREVFTGGGFGREMTEEQRKEMQEKMAKFAAETKAAYEKVLTPEQAKRATQIGYQLQGVRAFSDKDVQTALKISDDQKDTIKSIMETYAKDMQELRGGGGGGRPTAPSDESRKKMEALRKDVEEKITGKLSDEQKKAWKELVGEKFDTSKLSFQPMTRPRDN